VLVPPRRAVPLRPDPRAAGKGELLYEQRIFDEVFRIIDEAQSFVVATSFCSTS
jgi:hypothetical protein